MATVEVSEAEKVYILHGIRVRFFIFIILDLIDISLFCISNEVFLFGDFNVVFPSSVSFC